MRRSVSAAQAAALMMALLLFPGASGLIAVATSEAAFAQSTAGSEVTAQLGGSSGATRYQILRDLKNAGRIARNLTAADLNTIMVGMEEYRAKVIELMKFHLRTGLNAGDVVALSGQTSGSTRYDILYDLNSAGRIARGLTVADVNAIIVGMEEHRPRVIKLMRFHLAPSLSARDVVALCGQTSGSTRYDILYDLNSAGRIGRKITAADLNSIIAGMEDYRAEVIKLMRFHLATDISATDVAAASGTGAQTGVSAAPGEQQSSSAGPVAPDGSVGTLVERLIKAVPDNPPYLYEVDTVSGAIATVATDLLGSDDKRRLYDEYYYAAVEYRTMGEIELVLARRAAQSGSDAIAREHVDKAMRFLDRRTAYATAASEVFIGNIDTTYARVKPVYEASKITAKFLARVDPTPLTSTVIDAVFMGTDYCVNRANKGSDAARDQLIRDVALSVLMQVPSAQLGGRSIEDVIEGDMTKTIGTAGIYRILDEQLHNPAFQKKFMTVLARSGAAGAQLAAEYAFDDLLRPPDAADRSLFGGS